MQNAPAAKPPVGVVFDSNMGASIDPVLALAMLYGLESRSEARVVGLSVSKSNLRSAALCDAMVRFYHGRPLPVGMPDDGANAQDTPILEVAAKYPNGINTLNDTADPAAVIRNAFTAQHDQNCIMLVAGPLTNLARALALPGVRELAAAKVRYLVIAGSADEAALAGWPVPVYVCGPEIGEALRFPAKSIESDFAWAAGRHPVVDAYSAAGKMPYDAVSTAMAAVLHAVRPHEKYFGVSGTGPRRRLTLDPVQKDRVISAYTELAAGRPIDRAPRRT